MLVHRVVIRFDIEFYLTVERIGPLYTKEKISHTGVDKIERFYWFLRKFSINQ